jgi:hypothetical protein
MMLRAEIWKEPFLGVLVRTTGVGAVAVGSLLFWAEVGRLSFQRHTPSRQVNGRAGHVPGKIGLATAGCPCQGAWAEVGTMSTCK